MCIFCIIYQQQAPVPVVTVVTQQPVVTQVTFGERPVTYTDSDGNQVSFDLMTPSYCNSCQAHTEYIHDNVLQCVHIFNNNYVCAHTSMPLKYLQQ